MAVGQNQAHARHETATEGAASVTLNGNGGNDRDISGERFSVGDGANALERAWVRVRSRLRNEYGEAAFKNWLKSLTLLRGSGDKVVLAVTSKFWRDWIAAHYGDRLVALWKAENMGFN
ncbi:MAG: DnaA N-terminal domain-containing protein, partial [Alphaproteobacteria bacterium]